jgi:hypothetical protein
MFIRRTLKDFWNKKVQTVCFVLLQVQDILKGTALCEPNTDMRKRVGSGN